MTEVQQDVSEQTSKSLSQKIKEGHSERRNRLCGRIRRLIEAGGYGQEEEPEEDLPVMPLVSTPEEPIATQQE